MYDVVKNVIHSGSFELHDILTKIDTLWIQGSLTDAERMELTNMARDKADPANSYAPLQAQINALAARVKALEGADPDDPADEWPEYRQPTGAHDAYHNGDKVTFNGDRYTCTAPENVAVVWSPDTFPDYWHKETD